ncbi:MAG: HAMP domain-containing sensor histidine kinase [Cyanobacteria bacterium P01_F01_bin.53]
MWKRLLKETRTRILLMYALLLLILLVGVAVPIFRYLLFVSVDGRVQESLDEERDSFLESYAAWKKDPTHDVEDLKFFVTQFLQNSRPEDDNFQIVLINGEFYRSNPIALIEPLRPGSELFERWQDVTQFTLDEANVDDPTIGSILYTADPIILRGQQQGVFIIAHSNAGERQEALVGVYLFMQFTVVAVLISLLLSWLGAGRILSPIAKLASTARSISESDLTGRIPLPKGNDELTDLTNTFNDMMDRIQAAFDSQRAFINDAGHELRTPITIIQGHLELLDDDDPQERQETIELVMDELDRMGRLVSDMLLLAKAERPNFLKLETIETHEFTQAIFTKATALAQRNWILTIRGQGKMVGDRQKLTGAILNFIRNAVQHTQMTDTIELGCYFASGAAPDSDNCSGDSLRKDGRADIAQLSPQPSHQIQFWVRDTGEGISPSDQQRVFARFARGRHHHRRSEGSGLGLAIVAAVADAHGGQVTLDSEVNQGATFRLHLPGSLCDLPGYSR